MTTLTHADMQRVSELVYQHVQPTAALSWPLLGEAIGVQTWVKHENHTPIGAFKVRGGLVYLDELQRSAPGVEIVTATRGNHGQSIPFAARFYNTPVHVYVPEGNSSEKNAAMRAWGAQLHVHGVDFDEAKAEAARDAQARGAHLVPSYSEHLVRGVATYGMELFASVSDLDVVYVPIGMGSGACSLIAVRDLLGRSTAVVGVVSAAADAVARSLEAGRIVHTDTAHTFVDGVATRMPHPEAFDVMSKGLDRVVRVSDDEVAEAMRLLYRTTHNVAEGAGAAATAALMQEAAGGAIDKDARVAVILTGGNIDKDWFAQVLSGSTPVV